MDVDGRITACACKSNNAATNVTLSNLDTTVRLDAKGITIDGSAVATHNDLSELSANISKLTSSVADMQTAIEDIQKAYVRYAGGGLRRSDLRTLRVG